MNRIRLKILHPIALKFIHLDHSTPSTLRQAQCGAAQGPEN